MDDGKSREFQPFVEVNWLHNSKGFQHQYGWRVRHQDGAEILLR